MIATSIVKDVENSNIVGVIGHFSSGSTEATSKIYSLYNMPVISPTSTNVRMDLTTCRYKLRSEGILNSLLAPAPNGFTKNFLANYRYFFSPLSDLLLNKVCPIEKNVLDLDSNIFRMAPDDKVAQEKLFKYLSIYTASARKNNLPFINRIVLISEGQSSSTYSLNFHATLIKTIKEKNLSSDYAFSSDECLYNPESNKFKNEKGCREKILQNPEGITALLVVPSSKAIQYVQLFIERILRSTADRKRLIVLGADSLTTSDLSDPIYKGIVVTAASMEERVNFPLGSQNQSDVSFNWRSQMSNDSFVVFREALAKALKGKNNAITTRELKRLLISSIPAKIREASFNEENIEIKPWLTDTTPRSIATE